MRPRKDQFRCIIPKFPKNALLPCLPSFPTRPRLKLNHQPVKRPFLFPKPSKSINKYYFSPKPFWIQVCDPENAQIPGSPPFPWNEFSNPYHKRSRSIFTDPDREGPIQYAWEDKKKASTDHPKNWYWTREKRLKIARDKYIVAYLDEYVVKKGTHPLFLVDMLWFFANGLFEKAHVSGITFKDVRQAWETCSNHYTTWKTGLDVKRREHVDKAENKRRSNALAPPRPHLMDPRARGKFKYQQEKKATKLDTAGPKTKARIQYRDQWKEENKKAFVALGIPESAGVKEGSMKALKQRARVQLRRIKEANDVECGFRSLQAFGAYGVGRRSWYLLGQQCPSPGEIRKLLRGKAKHHFRNFLDAKAKLDSTHVIK